MNRKGIVSTKLGKVLTVRTGPTVYASGVLSRQPGQPVICAPASANVVEYDHQSGKKLGEWTQLVAPDPDAGKWVTDRWINSAGLMLDRVEDWRNITDPDKPQTTPIGIVPSDKTLGFVLRNFEWTGVSRPTHNRSGPRTKGLPDTCKLLDSSYVSLTREWQEFWFTILCRGAAGNGMSLAELKGAWNSLIVGYRFITNKFGPNNGYADYINGVNIGSDPVKYEPIITGGAVVEVLGGPYRKRGQLCWEIRTINASKGMPVPDPDVVNPTTEPYLFYCATSSVRRYYDEKKKKWLREDIEEPFYQLRGSNVYVPILSNASTNLIPINRVRILKPGDPIPGPYRFE